MGVGSYGEGGGRGGGGWGVTEKGVVGVGVGGELRRRGW